MSGPSPAITVCIVSYNSREEIGACLRALSRNKSISREILLWDNLPTDDTADYVRQNHPEVRIFGTGENVGYARANNSLFAEARGHLLYLLNPDTETEPDTLRRITDYFQCHPRVGIASTNLKDSNGSPLRPGVERYSRQSYTRGELGNLPGPLASVIGASMVVRREVLAATGGFDPAFFLYAEDEDLCLRARQNGWWVDIIAETAVIHREGSSEKDTPQEHFWKRKVGAAWQFYRKHYSAQTRWRIARNALLESRWRLGITRFPADAAKRVRYQQELKQARRELKTLRALRRSAAREGRYDHSVQDLLESGFRFEPFVVPGIDNQAVVTAFGGDLRLQEVALLAPDKCNAATTIDELHRFVWQPDRAPRPVVRFADGEYAFYRLNAAGCNGLYLQAESRSSIVSALPFHVEALLDTARHGQLCPLIYPAISRHTRLSGKAESVHESSAALWLRFLKARGIRLHAGNYCPFYAVYAYLCSDRFAQSVDGKNVVILNDDFKRSEAEAYFASRGSRPHLHWLSVPSEYAATRWPTARNAVLSALPASADLALVGAGAGALLVCRDVAQALQIPAIDAGHFLHIMNGCADKSGGPRLFTTYRDQSV